MIYFKFLNFKNLYINNHMHFFEKILEKELFLFYDENLIVR